MINNTFIFESSHRDNDSANRDAQLIRLDDKNVEFFNDIITIILESNKFNERKHPDFTSPQIKEYGKNTYSNFTFKIDDIWFSYNGIEYDIDGDDREITRIFKFYVGYNKKEKADIDPLDIIYFNHNDY